MKEKNVLITGASRGIGEACAKLFAAEGFHIFLNCNHSIEKLKKVKAEIEEIYPDSCTLVPGDVSDPDAVREMFRTIHSTCQGVDILINNAGLAHIGLLMDMTDGEWDRIIQTNLSSVFYCCREAVKDMVRTHSGRIINVSSMWGSAGASCEAAYSASKAGIHGLTKALAKELAPSGIPVNAIAFGVIDTTMNSQLDDEERRELEEEIPAGRFASPEEAAQMILRVAQSPAYMTGQIIGFDGGFL